MSAEAKNNKLEVTSVTRPPQMELHVTHLWLHFYGIPPGFDGFC